MKELLFDGHDYQIDEFADDRWEVYDSEGHFLFEVNLESEYYLAEGCVEADCYAPIHENSVNDVEDVIKSVISSMY